MKLNDVHGPFLQRRAPRPKTTGDAPNRLGLFWIGLVLKLEGALRVPTAYCTKQEFGSMREAEERRGERWITRREQAPVPRRGAIRCRMSARSHSTKWSGRYATNLMIACSSWPQARGLSFI